MRCFLLAYALLASPVVAGDRYVSPAGSDASAGTIGAPWRTLGHALRSTGAGDVIWMRGGSYPAEDLFKKITRGGAKGAYLTVRAFPGETPVLHDFTHFQLRKSYTRIEGLTFVNQGIGGGGTGNQIVGNTFTGTGYRYAVISAIGDELLVEGNTIDVTQRFTTDHAIYVMRGTGKTIRNNVILGCFGYGIHVFDEQKRPDPRQWVPFAIRAVVIEGNYIAGSQSRDGIIVAKGRGGSTIDLGDITIRNNVITGNSRGGITLREGVDIRIVHDTIVGNGASGILIGKPVRTNRPVSNLTISNNLLVTKAGGDHVRSFSTGGNIVLDTNLYWPASAHIVGVKDGHARFAEPKFVDAAGRDFHLLYGSPARDAGKTSVPSAPATDREGDPRAAGAGPDLGADEFFAHVYHTGNASPGGKVVFDVIGPPRLVAVWVLSLNAKLLSPPLRIAGLQGRWFLDAPLLAVALGIFPESGRIAHPLTLPIHLPRALTVPMQAVAGTQLSVVHSFHVD